jgi:hypothetical protein
VFDAAPTDVRAGEAGPSATKPPRTRRPRETSTANDGAPASEPDTPAEVAAGPVAAFASVAGPSACREPVAPDASADPPLGKAGTDAGVEAEGAVALAVSVRDVLAAAVPSSLLAARPPAALSTGVATLGATALACVFSGAADRSGVSAACAGVTTWDGVTAEGSAPAAGLVRGGRKPSGST